MNAIPIINTSVLKPMDYTELKQRISDVLSAVQATNRRIREIEAQKNEKR